MLEIDDFSRALASVYDASMDVERWSDTLSHFARMFGAHAGQLGVGSGLREIAFIKIWGLPDEVLARVMPKFIELTPTDPRGAMALIPYKAAHCRQYVTDEVLRGSEMYAEVLKPVGVEYAMSFTIPADPFQQDLMSVFSVMRGPEAAPFTSAECADLSRFAPHVARAVSMHAGFWRCRKEVSTVKALLDGVPLGMMVVEDDELKVANRAARTMLDEGDAVRLQRGRLCGASRRADADLQAAVDEALDSDSPVGVVVPVDHAEPMRAVVRRLHPASAGMVGAASREAVALYVTDPRKPHETREEILQRLFGLTPREAAVLRILVEGEDLHAIAARLGITFETVRSHVKHIMETTGASRQSELVRMVLASPAWIAR